MKNKNIHNLPRYLSKSPFIIAAFASGFVIGADILWLCGELLTHFEILSIQQYVYYRCMILGMLTAGLCITITAVRAYLKNGYMRFEHKVELEHKKELQSQCKRDRIFK
jgi:hypothetical protein